AHVGGAQDVPGHPPPAAGGDGHAHRQAAEYAHHAAATPSAGSAPARGRAVTRCSATSTAASKEGRTISHPHAQAVSTPTSRPSWWTGRWVTVWVRSARASAMARASSSGVEDGFFSGTMNSDIDGP